MENWKKNLKILINSLSPLQILLLHYYYYYNQQRPQVGHI